MEMMKVKDRPAGTCMRYAVRDRYRSWASLHLYAFL
jgi:hypothetical protein